MKSNDLIKSQNGKPSLPEGQFVWIPPGYELSTNPPAQEAESHLWDHLWLVWRRRWLVILVFLICLGITTLVTLRATPIYESVAKLRIEQDSSKVSPLQEDRNDSYYYDSSKLDFIETQRQILQGREIAQLVIKRLNWGVEDKNATKDGAAAATGKWAAMLNDAQASLKNFKAYLVSFLGSKAEEKKSETGDPAARELQQRVGAFLGSLNVSQIKNTEIVEVRFMSEDPRQATSVANAVCEDYIKWTYQSKFDSYDYARTWLKEKLDDMKGKLEESEEKLNKMSIGGDYIALTENTDPLAQQIEATRQKLNEAEHLLFEKEYELKRFDNDSGFGVLADGNQQIQKLIQDYRDAQVQYDKAISELGPGSGEVKKLLAAKDRLEGQLKEERQRAIKTAKFEHEQALANRDFIKKGYETEKSRITGIQQGYIQYNILKREVDVNRELYNSLLQRWKEVGVAAGVKPSNVSIVESAVDPLTPKLPNKRRNMLLGAFLGLFLGIGLVFFVDYMDTSVKSAEELERVAQLVVLGHIPYFNQRRLGGKDRIKTELALHQRPKSAFSESIRTIRTSVQYSLPGRTPKIVLVTSCFPSEGKSTFSANLAISLAQRNKSVLLIDADLKKPTVHKIFDIERNLGLSEVLTGKFDGENIPESFVSNLHVLTSGSKPPNPVDLLDSDVMRNFLTRVAQNYDHVIIDSAPMLNMADTVVLAPYVDGVILVVHQGKTPRGAVRQAKERLTEVQGHILGAVLNNPKQLSSDRYGQSYGYGGYGYGYGYKYGYGGYGQDKGGAEEEDNFRGRQEEIVDILVLPEQTEADERHQMTDKRL